MFRNVHCWQTLSAPAAALICSITAPLIESNLTSLSTGISFPSTETENTTAVCVCVVLICLTEKNHRLRRLSGCPINGRQGKRVLQCKNLTFQLSKSTYKGWTTFLRKFNLLRHIPFRYLCSYCANVTEVTKFKWSWCFQ